MKWIEIMKRIAKMEMTIFTVSEFRRATDLFYKWVQNDRKKPRDFFDLYFILRSGISRKIVAAHKAKLMDEVKKINDKTITNELKLFHPRSYWPVLRDFRNTLLKELKRR